MAAPLAPQFSELRCCSVSCQLGMFSSELTVLQLTHLHAVQEPDGVQVVQQGHPCHLYFDLEFATSANPSLQGEGLVDLLIRLVTQYFRCRHGHPVLQVQACLLSNSGAAMVTQQFRYRPCHPVIQVQARA